MTTRSPTSLVPQPGDLLSGKFRIERTLGAGGMGVVLAARHVDLGQPFAIKFLNAQYAEHPEVVARFLREARAAAAIKSEHVARVVDITRAESGAPYIVMEHLEGHDLEQLVRARGPLPIAEAVDYVLQACEAIAEAHAAKIIHRDLKPGNLFLTHRADGSPLVKVLDFGMSKFTALDGAVGDGSLTSPVAMLGSPWYMSPEQVKASKFVDHRTDVWALGVILHKLLTATPAFDGETMSSCLVKIVTEPPATLRSRRADAPAGLEAVILRCLEKDVDRRLQSVAELAWALLPFAPERSRISAERIVRVLQGADLQGDRTLPLSPAAAAPYPVAQEPTPAPQPVPEPVPPPAPSPSFRSAHGFVSAPVPRSTSAPRWLWAAIPVAVLLLAGAALLLRSPGAIRDQTAAAASSPPPLASPPPVAPAATATATAEAPAAPEAPPTAAPSATPPPKKPVAPSRPASPPPAPPPSPAPRGKVQGPMENSL